MSKPRPMAFSEREFKSIDIRCPVCGAPEGKRCPQGPNHVERGRIQRWQEMGFLPSNDARPDW
jgi:hypothetical protein